MHSTSRRFTEASLLLFSTIIVCLVAAAPAWALPSTYVCVDCGSHNVTVWKVDDCTTAPEISYECNDCGNTGVHSAGSHSFVTTGSQSATCTAEGISTTACEICSIAPVTTTTPALGHAYPASWTVARAATTEYEGLEVLICSRCGDQLSRTIAKLPAPAAEETTEEATNESAEEGEKSNTPENEASAVAVASSATSSEPEKTDEGTFPIIPIAAGAGVVAIVGGAVAFFRRQSIAAVATGTAAAAATTAVAAGAEAATLGKVDLEDKNVLLYLEDSEYNNALYELLDGQSFLDVEQIGYGDEESLLEEVAEGIDVVILNITEQSPADSVDQLMKRVSEVNKDVLFGLVVSNAATIEDIELSSMKEAGQICGYAREGLPGKRAMIALILPAYKPELSLDYAIESIGVVADAFNIPVISTIVNAKSITEEVHEILEKKKMGVDEGANLIGDIADILGFDELSDVIDLIDDLSAAKDLAEYELTAENKI